MFLSIWRFLGGSQGPMGPLGVLGDSVGVPMGSLGCLRGPEGSWKVPWGGHFGTGSLGGPLGVLGIPHRTLVHRLWKSALFMYRMHIFGGLHRRWPNSDAVGLGPRGGRGRGKPLPREMTLKGLPFVCILWMYTPQGPWPRWITHKCNTSFCMWLGVATTLSGISG